MKGVVMWRNADHPSIIGLHVPSSEPHSIACIAVVVRTAAAIPHYHDPP